MPNAASVEDGGVLDGDEVAGRALAFPCYPAGRVTSMPAVMAPAVTAAVRLPVTGS
jgi:hypothetical protein